MKREEKAAVRRVLRLVDGYLSGFNQTALLSDRGGGLMTVHELRQHVRGAIKLVPKSKPGKGVDR